MSNSAGSTYCAHCSWGPRKSGISISGGDRQTSFRVSGSHLLSKGMNSYSGADSRTNISFNLNHKTLNQKFELSIAAFYSFAKIDNIMLSVDAALPPTAPGMFNANGDLNYEGWEPDRFSYPFASLFRPYESKTGMLNGNAKINYYLTKGLKLSASFGYSTNDMLQTFQTPIRSQDPIFNPKGTAFFGSNKGTRSIIEPTIDYQRFIGPGKLHFLVGGSFQSTQQKGSFATGNGYINDNLLHSINNALVKNIIDRGGEYKYLAAYTRLDYNVEDKYILTLSGRRDGSSKFGSGKRFGNFGSVAAAWIFSESKLVKEQLPFLSFGKLRTSYGIIGTDNTLDYGYLSKWQATVPYQNGLSYIPSSLTNRELRWQIDNKFEIALNLGLLQDRISIELAWYSNISKNQLIDIYPLPFTTGFESVSSNFPGVVRNTGFEPSINLKIIQSTNVDLQTNVQIGFNRNKLLDFPGLASSPYSQAYVIGMPLSIRKVVIFKGIDPQTGKYTYEDINKNGTIGANSQDDDRIFKDITQKYDGGFGVDFRYKNLDINLHCHFRKQLGQDPRVSLGTPGQLAKNLPVDALNRWRKPGDVAVFPRLTIVPEDSDILYQSSDAAYVNASFVRLNNISLAYHLSDQVVRKLKLKGIKLHLSGQNLLVVTSYKGTDPEIQQFGALPIPASIVGGLTLNL